MKLGALTTRYLNLRRNDLARSTRKVVGYTLHGASLSIGRERDAQTVRRRHVEEWLAGMGCQASTIRTRLSIFRVFCQWSVNNGHMRNDPTLGVTGPRMPRGLPRELETGLIDKLLLAVPDMRGTLVVLLAVAEGMRVSEIAGQLRENIDMTGGLMLVRGKGRKERWLPITGQTMDAIRGYYREIPGQTGPLIRNARFPQKGISAEHLGSLVCEWMYASGVKEHSYDGRSAHALRHTMAGVMLDGGADIRDVQAALGHENLSATYIYLRRRQASTRLRDAMGSVEYQVPG